jgi:hypothetical protein
MHLMEAGGLRSIEMVRRYYSANDEEVLAAYHRGTGVIGGRIHGSRRGLLWATVGWATSLNRTLELGIMANGCSKLR